MFQVLSLKFQEKGVTLIEIIAVIFLIALFSAILIADFPAIQRQYAISRATYKLSQDFRRAQDLGLSAVQLKNTDGDPITTVKGYGIYIDLNQSTTQYILYADLNASQTFDNSAPKTCDLYDPNPPADTGDCIIETVDINEGNQNVHIKGVNNAAGFSIGGDSVSINFSPPNPTINIEDNLDANYSEVGIVLGIGAESADRTVKVNSSGLISVE